MFIKRIQAACKKQCLKDEADMKQQRLRDEAKIKKALFNLFETDEGFTIQDRIVKFKDGLMLKAYWEYGHLEFAIRGRCPQCGENTWSSGASSLEGLGQKWAEFKPDYQHKCAISEIPTAESNLIDSLVEFVRFVVGTADE